MSIVQKPYKLIVLLLVLMFGLVGCSTTKENVDGKEKVEKEEINELIVARKADAGNIDPHFISSNPTANYVYGKVYESLVSRDKDSNYIPALAEEWSQIDDLTWEFKLRKDVKFHDGSDFNAEAVKQVFDRLLDEKTASPRAVVFSMLKEVEVKDDYTAVLHLNNPFSALLSVLASSEGSIISPKAFNEGGVDLSINAVGTGPFKFESWKPGQEMVLLRNEEYWGTKPSFEKLTYKVVPEESTRVAMVETGEAHVADQLPVTELNRVEGSSSMSVLRTEGFGVEYIGFNVEKEPFTDVKVRQAIAHAIEKDAIIKGVYNSVGSRVASALAPKVIGFHDGLKDFPYDVNQAKNLLKEAGFPNGFKTTIVTDDRKERINLAEVIQSQLKGIGVEVEIQVLEYGVYIETLSEGKSEMFIGGWGNATGDADYNQYNVFHSSSAGPVGNFSFYKNPVVDKLIEDARKEPNEEKRMELYAELQEIELEEAPLIPIRTLEHLSVTAKGIDHVWMNPVGFFFFE
ncbi:glutathione ABC transporter substrate-binding protein [Bacillus sp. JJ1532]|uniref:glutathione ABC transporter substrate-binding protein n=1 Tax=Bacillus sp. JJ1532 TaxID=3122958 RepID=UPI002FFE2A67